MKILNPTKIKSGRFSAKKGAFNNENPKKNSSLRPITIDAGRGQSDFKIF